MITFLGDELDNFKQKIFYTSKCNFFFFLHFKVTDPKRQKNQMILKVVSSAFILISVIRNKTSIDTYLNSKMYKGRGSFILLIESVLWDIWICDQVSFKFYSTYILQLGLFCDHQNMIRGFALRKFLNGTFPQRK